MIRKGIFITLILITSFLPSVVNAGVDDNFDYLETDRVQDTLVYFFDLRDRESYIQLTHANSETDGNTGVNVDIDVHVIIFDVSRDCVENNFFDIYTPNDTHVYNMRDIQTNDGNPSGVVLPDDAYGFVFTVPVNSTRDSAIAANVFIGNLRVVDNNGYEYRTNASTEPGGNPGPMPEKLGYFNYNTKGDITLSDIIGVMYDDTGITVEVAEITENFALVNVDIYDLNENPFSCRNVIFACVNQDSIRLEELLEFASENSSAGASVASSEYGINDAIPHSKGGPLLCPGNNISEGFVTMEVLNEGSNTIEEQSIWIGLNNGNGRGSLDSFWHENPLTLPSVG